VQVFISLMHHIYRERCNVESFNRKVKRGLDKP